MKNSGVKTGLKSTRVVSLDKFQIRMGNGYSPEMSAEFIMPLILAIRICFIIKEYSKKVLIEVTCQANQCTIFRICRMGRTFGVSITEQKGQNTFRKRNISGSKQGYKTRFEKSGISSGKKCNLTLAISPTCHSNNALPICHHEFFLECSQ